MVAFQASFALVSLSAVIVSTATTAVLVIDESFVEAYPSGTIGKGRPSGLNGERRADGFEVRWSDWLGRCVAELVYEPCTCMRRYCNHCRLRERFIVSILWHLRLLSVKYHTSKGFKDMAKNKEYRYEGERRSFTNAQPVQNLAAYPATTGAFRPCCSHHL
jgi:hypothetical protein